MTDATGECGVSGSGHPALARLGHDPDRFAQHHWDREPAVTRAAPSWVAGLIDIATVDRLLSDQGLRTPFLRVAKGGRLVPATQYTRGGGAGAQVGDQVADDALASLFADGHTLVLQGLHRMLPSVGRFTRELTHALGHPVQANAYLTAPGNRGFASHYDTHDVLVLQIHGRKAWRIHRPVRSRPIPDEPWERYADDVRARAEETPVLTPTIGPADVLYLPRGWLHAADAVGDDVSLHITFGIHAATGLDVLRAAVDLLTVASGSQGADDPYALRRSLPIGDALGGEVATARARQDAARLLEDLADSDVSHATRRRRDRLTRPDPIGPVAHAALIATMDQATEVVRRPRLAVQIVPAANGGLSIEPAVGPALTVGPALADATTEVLSGRVCTAEGLPGETSDVLELLRMMARSGLVVAVGDMNT